MGSATVVVVVVVVLWGSTVDHHGGYYDENMRARACAQALTKIPYLY
jgi:hypothetical protein